MLSVLGTLCIVQLKYSTALWYRCHVDFNKVFEYFNQTIHKGTNMKKMQGT